MLRPDIQSKKTAKMAISMLKIDPFGSVVFTRLANKLTYSVFTYFISMIDWLKVVRLILILFLFCFRDSKVCMWGLWSRLQVQV